MTESSGSTVYPPVQPGLMVIHGNRPEDLRDLLVAWLQRNPLRPLENELMLVQSNGIAQWLKLALARSFDEGGLNISAAVDVQLPGRFLWNAYRTVLGAAAVPPTSPFDKTRLVWRLLRLLPKHRDDPDFAPLKPLLGDASNWRKRYQLALQIADQFDQYQVYRADWLADWERGRDVMHDALRDRVTVLPVDQRWQSRLWRLLLADVGSAQRENHRAAVHRHFMEQTQLLSERPEQLPRRIVVFGISSLPQQTLEALTSLSRLCQVLLLVNNPCRHYWADIIEDRELLKATQRRHSGKPGLPPEPRYEDLHLHANPLLAAWGKQGRDYIRLLDSVDRPDAYRKQFAALNRSIDLFADVGNDTLLHQVQQSILELEPLPVDPAKRKTLSANDVSLRFHVAHNTQRDVEILHDQLLAAFEQAAHDGSPLAPRDVMVMVPDIRIYAPHIQAVFGRLSPDDPRYLPYSIADQPSRGTAPLLVALEHLLHLPESRLAASDILDLLHVPALRRRFEIDEASLPTLRRWIEGAGIRWGLDGKHKVALGLPDVEQNSWRFGLRRMLLGYAVGDGASIDDVAPYADIGGLDAALIGPLVQLVEQLEHYWTVLSTPATCTQWCDRLRRLLHDFFNTEGDDADTLSISRLDDALDNWQEACAEADFNQAMPIAIVREQWLQAIDESRLSQRFMAGAVNFGTLLPMRAIPFRVICLLGMNDADYPRRYFPPDFDLMALAGHQRPGDRSRREDDRYLFLEALLSARDALHISWVGRSARDNSELPPSVLVGQLRDYLAGGWRLPGHHENMAESRASLLSALTTEYPLQAFSRRYFETSQSSALFTYAHEWERALVAKAAVETAVLAPWQPDHTLDISFVQRFLAAPVATFFNQRLKVYLAELEMATENDEPFSLNGLENYAGTAALLNAGMNAEASFSEQALQQATTVLHQEGALPTGGIGEIASTQMADNARHTIAAWHDASDRWPQRADPCEVRYEGHGLIVEDWLDDLRHDGKGGYIRLVAMAGALRDKKAIRYDKLVAAWVVHLFAHANRLNLITYVMAADAGVVMRALDPQDATAQLDMLLAALKTGMQAPLPIARRTAFAWLLAEKADKDATTAATQSYDPTESNWGGSIGDVQRDAYLARTWPDFARLHAAGFEQWLGLYRPLLEATHEEDIA